MGEGESAVARTGSLHNVAEPVPTTAEGGRTAPADGVDRSDAREGIDDPFADITESSRRPGFRFGGRILAAALVLAVLGILAWQILTLRSQIHTLRTTDRAQQYELTELHSDLTNLHNSYVATVTCLAGGPAQKSLCLRFMR